MKKKITPEMAEAAERRVNIASIKVDSLKAQNAAYEAETVEIEKSIESVKKEAQKLEADREALEKDVESMELIVEKLKRQESDMGESKAKIAEETGKLKVQVKELTVSRDALLKEVGALDSDKNGKAEALRVKEEEIANREINVKAIEEELGYRKSALDNRERVLVLQSKAGK